MIAKPFSPHIWAQAPLESCPGSCKWCTRSDISRDNIALCEAFKTTLYTHVFVVMRHEVHMSGRSIPTSTAFTLPVRCKDCLAQGIPPEQTP